MQKQMGNVSRDRNSKKDQKDARYKKYIYTYILQQKWRIPLISRMDIPDEGTPKFNISI